MTIAAERLRAINQSRKFLDELINPKGRYKRVPKEVRRAALICLRHFPNEAEVKIDGPDITVKGDWFICHQNSSQSFKKRVASPVFNLVILSRKAITFLLSVFQKRK